MPATRKIATAIEQHFAHNEAPFTGCLVFFGDETCCFASLAEPLNTNRMHFSKIFLLALTAFFSTGGLQNAQAATGAKSVATLVAEESAIAPGSTFSVAMQLQHPEEWHSYYLNSGGVELPPTIKWTLPEGFTAGPIQWPVPEVKDGFFGKSFVYNGSPIFLVELTAPATLKLGETFTFTAVAEWQICKASCINEEANFTLTLPVAAAAGKNPANAALFSKARAAQPLPAGDIEISANTHSGEVLLRIESPTPPTEFIPNQPSILAASAGGSITREGDAWLITLKRATKDAFENPIPQDDSISGILVATTAIKIPLTPLTISSSAATALPIAQFLPILGGMLLGGLILNLMPCVFPVIGLKIMGFVQQAGSERKKIALHGLIFALGVFASFGLLSGILFAARGAGGDAIGWGYQLQDPRIVLGLMLLMFLLALNMFGLFELGTSATSVGGNLQSKQGFGGTFFSGVLATIVATPCSAPFLGVAIGAAIGLPAFQFFAAFAAMAAGLALPYLVLSIFPKLLEFLPRPGAWMESFKQAMSFLLFATTGYLLWVYAGQIGLENLLGPIFGLSAIAIAAWIYGRWFLPHRPRSSRVTALILTAAFALAGFYLVKPPGKSALVWEPWTAEKATSLTAAGTPVFIDFTAQWCATCQVNKKFAYTAEVIAIMERKGIVALKADKTRANPAIDAQLRKLGRSAIPVNVLLLPNQEPIITPELLTPAYLIDLFNRIPATPPN